jgi:predicted enzyme related to lactoylglutathione lyase
VAAGPLAAAELFNAAAELFARGEVDRAVPLLRGGFFENVYVAPLLLGEACHRQEVWHSSAEAEPQAAREYVGRYGRLWQEDSRALEFLAAVWNDPLVRAELRNYLNLLRNILAVRREAKRAELLRERDVFLNPERLKRTQSEILGRLSRARLDLPVRRPRLGLILLASRDPAATVRFYEQLFAVAPSVTSGTGGGYAEFELDGVHLGVHGLDRPAAGDPYALGPPPEALGWGAILVIRVADLDRYHENAGRAGIEIVDSDLSAAGRRFFVVKDPSGYLLEVTEEEPRGIELF